MALSFAIQQTNVQYTLTLKYQFSSECLRALNIEVSVFSCIFESTENDRLR
jgi:hypothetical protein